jgi:Mn2+/Fe2+ NRAMP family transporter
LKELKRTFLSLLSLDVVSVVFILVLRNGSAFLETSVVVVLVFLFFFFFLLLLLFRNNNIIVGKNRTRKTTAETTRTKNGRDE